MLLRRHNLNLLPVLRELLRTRNVSETAECVGLSRSAVSVALGKLRRIYNDELLVMVDRHLELTKKGTELVEKTERACLEMEALLRPSEFDPARETRRFVVATADYVAFLLAPVLARVMAATAPLASVHFVDVPSDISSQLARGKIDALIVPADTAADLEESCSSALLFVDDMVVIASKRHRAFAGQLTREVYETSRRARFKMFPTSQGHQDYILRDNGIDECDSIVVQQFLNLPAIVEASDCLALVYRRLAEPFLRGHDIEIMRPPFELSPIGITAYWSRLAERAPAHAWFRKLLIDAGRNLEAGLTTPSLEADGEDHPVREHGTTITQWSVDRARNPSVASTEDDGTVDENIEAPKVHSRVRAGSRAAPSATEFSGRATASLAYRATNALTHNQRAERKHF